MKKRTGQSSLAIDRVPLATASGFLAPVVVVAALAFGAMSLGGSEASVAAPPACSSSSMYTVAHEDDSLLFQSPSLLQDIRKGHCVRTVFLTAGDAGLGEPYWAAREEGAEAAYAEMAGVEDLWTGAEIVVKGHPIHTEILAERPGISLVFLRLPDGGVSGRGTGRYGHQSMAKLWKTGNGEASGRGESAIRVVDGSTKYHYRGLIKTLAQLMRAFAPKLIATQNFKGKLVGPDHPDHIAGAYFTHAAVALYRKPHRLLAFRGYDAASRRQNVFGDLLAAKSAALYTYGAHDTHACSDPVSCAGTPYAKWLRRQYAVP